MARLEHVHEIWKDYNKTRQDLEKLLQEQFNVERLACSLEQEQSEEMCLQVIHIDQGITVDIDIVWSI